MGKLTVAILSAGVLLTGCEASGAGCFKLYPVKVINISESKPCDCGEGFRDSQDSALRAPFFTPNKTEMVAFLDAGRLTNDGVEWDYISEGDAYEEAKDAAMNEGGCEESTE